MNMAFYRASPWLSYARRMSSRTKSREIATFGVVVAAHIGLLLILIGVRPRTIPYRIEGVEVSLVSGLGRSPLGPRPSTKAEAIPKPPSPAPPSPLASKIVSPSVDEIQPLDVKLAAMPRPLDAVTVLLPQIALVTSAPSSAAAQSSMAPDAASAAVSGQKRCEILEVLQASLQLDPAARSAIARIPAKAKSVANAVLVWDGAWTTPDSLGGPLAFVPIQKVVLDGIGQAPPNCRDDLVRGPRLIVIGDQHDSTVLVFGSGEWRWSDMLLNPPTPLPNH